MVLSAIHQAVGALAKMAGADLAAITTAGDAGRLYMPNIILWDEHARARDYAASPPDRIQLLREVYQITVSTSRRAAESLDSLALGTGASSSVPHHARDQPTSGTRKSGRAASRRSP
jgi:hypothetical protein